MQEKLSTTTHFLANKLDILISLFVIIFLLLSVNLVEKDILLLVLVLLCAIIVYRPRTSS